MEKDLVIEDESAVSSFESFTIPALYDAIVDANSDEERVALLYSVKSICITYGIDKPKWWYKQRNNTDWLDDDGFHYGYDLGGF